MIVFGAGCSLTEGSWLVTVRSDPEGDGVRAARVWRAVLGVEYTVVEGVDLERAGIEEVLVTRVGDQIDRADAPAVDTIGWLV